MFQIIKSLYEKTTPPNISYNIGICMVLSRLLSFDRPNIHKIKQALGYILYIEPAHYIYLLFCLIPERPVPFLKNYAKKTSEMPKIYRCIQLYFGWSEKDLKFSKSILDKVIDIKYWKREFGI